MPANLVNAERVSKAYGVRSLLTEVSLGIAEGERIGVIGRNGDGKTTLLHLVAKVEEPDSGRVTHTGGLRVGLLGQDDNLEAGATVGALVVGDRPEHEWRADRRIRDVLDGLLADVALERIVNGLSGGERRRVALARLLLDSHDLLLLDEPTNHLDLEVADWLARHLGARREALVVVTHDRWFLDAVCTATWELVGGQVHAYEGGYAAYVLARAERERLSEAAEAKRKNLLRKELAWLRRGAPARTSKPKFRLDAATELIEDEPPPRDPLELSRLATARLGKTVVDLENVDVRLGDKTIADQLTWQLGPGDRVGLIGVNGAGKTTVLRLIAGERDPDAGKVRQGQTVRLAHLTQDAAELDPGASVTDAVESVRRTVRLAPTNVRPGAIGRRPVPTAGPEVTTVQLLERFGFTGDRLRTRVGDLSGGERRRLQLLRLLVDQPNVLCLDEPTNDLDIDTLRVIEDFLDEWPGSLVVVTHDRYFLERVCDSVWALLGDGSLAQLPGGVEEYLERRRAAAEPPAGSGSAGAARSGGGGADRQSDAAAERAAKKELGRLDRQLNKLSERADRLHAELAKYADDYERLMELDEQLRAVKAEQAEVEERWLEVAEQVS